MKIVRALLIVFGVAIVATALATAAAFVPAVQRWALLRIAAGRPGTSLRVERLAVRPGSINVHRLQLVRPGLRVTLDDVAAGFSLWEAVAHRRLVVRDLRITGLQVDLTNPPQAGGGAFAGTPPPLPSSPSTATASPATDTPPEPAFAGILNHLQPPFEIVVASCHAEAEIILPGTAGRPARHLRVILTGGHFAPGRQAQFDFEAAIHGQDSSTPVDQIEGRGVLTATLDRQSRFERIGVHLEATASGPLLPARARLEADVTVARTAEGETYALALRSPEAGGENRLLDLEVAYVAGVARLAGSWQVRASRQQVAPFTLGATLPEFSAVGEGRFELNPAIRRARLTGRIAGGISQLEVLDPRLRAVGRLGATAAFDLEYGGDEVRISQLVVSLSGRKSVLTMEAVQPFSIELASQVLTAADPRRELLQVNLEGLPLAWARPFLPAIELAGDEVTGAFVASLREGRMWLRTTSPLAVRNFALARSGRVVLAASDIRIQAELEHAKTATRIKLDALTLETAAGDRVDAQGEWNLESGIPAVTTLRASVTAVLPTLLAAYAPVGPVQGRGAVVCTASGGIWQVDHLDARVTTPEGRVLLDLSSGVAFQFDHARWKVAASAAGSSEVLRLEFGRLPLAMFQPYLGVCRLGGDLLPGELRARLDQGGLRVAAATPLHVEQFAAGGAGGAWVRDLSVELEPVADFAAEGVTVKLAAARVSNAGGAPLLSAHAEAVFGTEAGSPGVRGTAGFDLSVPALAGQPILGGRLPPTQGRIAGEGKFTFDRDLRGEGRITLNGLVSPATHEPLPVANLSFRAGWSEQGTVAVQVPLLIDRSGERSDLTVAATLRPDDHGRQLEARISGQHFVVDDARALIHAFGPPPAAPAGEPPAGVPASAAPWAALSGQVTLDVKSLVCDRNLEVTGLAGRITLAPGRLAAEKITGRLGAEGQLQFSGPV